MKCNSRKEKSCLSFEEFLDCRFSGKYLACCSEAKHLKPSSNSSFSMTMLYLRVRILLHLTDIFRAITMNEDLVDLVASEGTNSERNKNKKPRHIYQQFSQYSQVKIVEPQVKINRLKLGKE